MTPLARYVGENARKGLPVVVGYLPGPYPTPERMHDGLQRLKRAGFSCLEIGIPDTVPPIEGEVIAHAMEELLRLGWDPLEAIDVAGAAAQEAGLMAIAVVYPDTARRFGTAVLLERLSDAGFAGIIVPGATGELRRELCVACRRHAVASVAFFPAEDFASANAHTVAGQLCESDALVYLQTAPGPTGGEFNPSEELRARVQWAHKIGGNGSARRRMPPVALGFGIKDADDARAAFDLGADVVIIGTAMVEAYEAGPQAFDRYLAQFRPIVG